MLDGGGFIETDLVGYTLDPSYSKTPQTYNAPNLLVAFLEVMEGDTVGV